MYDRWGMTNADAATLTGTAEPTDAAMDAAEAELVDWLGWEPDETAYDPDTDRRAAAFGKAVAWQTAWRVDTPATADDGGKVITAESVPDYSVTYAAGGVAELEEVAPRARRLLVRGGWTARAREGSTGLGTRIEPERFQ